MNLEGVKALSKMEQKSVFGGEDQFLDAGACDSSVSCVQDSDCPASCTCQDYSIDEKRCK